MGVCKFDAVLVEVGGQRELAAERIAAAGQIHFVLLVVARDNQHGNVQLRKVQRGGYAHFVAEVGENDEDAVDFAAVRLEQLRAFDGVFIAFDRAVPGFPGADNDGAVPHDGEPSQNDFTRVLGQKTGEESACGYDHSEC
jgi:hypothetical protein